MTQFDVCSTIKEAVTYTKITNQWSMKYIVVKK